MSDPRPDDETREAPKRPGSTGGGNIPTVDWQPGGAKPTSRIGRFAVTKLLGEGAFGRVYLAFDSQLERQVAVKVPKPEGLTLEFRDRFLREARATAKIHHPNVCPVHEVGTAGDLPYIVMHYVVGTTLAALLERLHAAMPPRHALTIARKLALGMSAAHAKGVVHRDLKPANVLYEASSREVLITDFGLALIAADTRMTADGVVCGTPSYMSPEQAKGRASEIGPLSDVYSLGVIFYRMLTGSVPFTGSMYEVMMQHAEAAPAFPSVLCPGLDPRLDAIVLRAMAKRPADRYPSAKAFADTLAGYLRADGRTESDAELPFATLLRDEPPAPQQQALPPALQRAPTARTKRRWGRRVLAGLFVMALAAGGAAAWWWQSDLQRLFAPAPDGPAPAPAPDPAPTPTTELAPPPHLKESAAKFDLAKLIGRWERITPTASPWVWEFAREGTSRRAYGIGAPVVAPYAADGAALSFGAATKTTYTITKLTDDELELKTETGVPYAFKRAKSKEPDPPVASIDRKKLIGKWERPQGKKESSKDVLYWEFTADGKLLISSSTSTVPPTPRPYALDGDKLSYETKNTYTYTITKLTDDELEVKSSAGVVNTFKRVKPESKPKP